MNKSDLTHEESFLKTIQCTIKAQRLIRDGGELDSLEFNIIRDEISQHWYNMTEEQKNSIWNLSKRLDQLSNLKARPGSE